MNFDNRLNDIDALNREIQNHRPLNRYALKQLREYYRVGLTWSSNALEGNSLTETETKIVLEDGVTIGGKSLRDHYEAAGHSEAFDLLYRLAKRTEITERDILELHRLFFYRIDKRNAGRYRRQTVIITGSTLSLPTPSELKETMGRFVEQIPAMRESLHPVKFAAWLHIRLATIHPFIDGNGRAARLLMNLALLQGGYPITIIPPILRADYIEALKTSNQGDERPFVNFVSSMVWEAQRDYLRLLNSLDRE